MTTTFKKTPMVISSGENATEAQPWRVKTADGRVRGPVGLEGLKSLFEVGILSSAARISHVRDKNWHPIVEHPLWPLLALRPQPLRLRNAELMEEASDSLFLGPTSPVSEERMLRMEAMRHGEVESSYRSLVWWKFGRSLKIVREVLIFLGFLTAGDLGTSFFDASAGLMKWVLLLCLTCVAVVYYSVRALAR